jgi:protein-S-isoprenylcysteine O-methyltransferase Ste14
VLFRIPAIIVASSVSIYWLAVLVKCILIAPRIGRLPNVVPREPTGRLLRLFWTPLVLLWIAAPWSAVRKPSAATLNLVLGGCGAALCVTALLLSFLCWRQMGLSWRIGIDPQEKTALVVTGPFRHVRHPIYALSILLMLGTVAAVPTWWMATIAVAHTVLLLVEARREEKYLLRHHGEAYGAYRATTGRFVPRGICR